MTPTPTQGAGADETDCLLDVLPIAHNLPLACPGLQGFWFAGARVVLHPSTRGSEVFPLIERHRVTHIHVVPALLITWLNDPEIGRYDLSSVRVIQSGGQRLQPETRLRMCACVQLRSGAPALSLDVLVDHLRRQEIVPFKLPERLEILDSFPLSPVGKISKKNLVMHFTSTDRVSATP